MTNPFKRFFKQAKQIENAHKVIAIRDKQIEALTTKIGDPKYVVESIMDGDVRWFDYSTLPQDKLASYHIQAQEALKNSVVKNEMNRLINEWSEFALLKAKDFAVVRDLRMQASGLKLLMERLAEIPDPTKQDETANDPYAPL